MKNEDFFIKGPIRDNIVAYLRTLTLPPALGRNIANIIDVLNSLPTVSQAEKKVSAEDAQIGDLEKKDINSAGT